MKNIMKFSFFAALVVATNVFAADKACMIEGDFVLLGQKIHSKDCMQIVSNASLAQGKEMCEGLAKTSATMGGKAGKVTYLPACPMPSQGICKGMGEGLYDTYYYARSADDVKTLPQGCKALGGTWASGTK